MGKKIYFCTNYAKTHCFGNDKTQNSSKLKTILPKAHQHAYVLPFRVRLSVIVPPDTPVIMEPGGSPVQVVSVTIIIIVIIIVISPLQVVIIITITTSQSAILHPHHNPHPHLHLHNLHGHHLHHQGSMLGPLQQGEPLTLDCKVQVSVTLKQINIAQFDINHNNQ